MKLLRRASASIAVLLAFGLFVSGPAAAAEFEYNTDRMGQDYSNFDLPAPDAEMCRDACRSDGRCKAWTYVKPNTIQGPRPRCWLKSSVPPARSATCCISGVKRQGGSGGAEFDTDRPGQDYSNFNLPAANFRLCRRSCRDDTRCRAWTYVRPNTIQGPQPRCWLKNGVPAARRNNCCVSGVVR